MPGGIGNWCGKSLLVGDLPQVLRASLCQGPRVRSCRLLWPFHVALEVHRLDHGLRKSQIDRTIEHGLEMTHVDSRKSRMSQIESQIEHAGQRPF
jgi:hypothetical protein